MKLILDLCSFERKKEEENIRFKSKCGKIVKMNLIFDSSKFDETFCL
jgi:hypothetical protein